MTDHSTRTQEKRFVSIILPHFAIENYQLSKPGQQLPEHQERSQQRVPPTAPFALVDMTSRGQRLSAVNETAKKHGLAPEMALSDALALCPLLQTSKAVPQTDARKLLQLAKWCERYSPLSNVHGGNALWIDVTGIAHLFNGEKGLLEQISKDFLKLGHTTELALASSFAAAFALARFAFDKPLETRIIPSGISFEQLQHALDPLPVIALRLCPKTVSLLNRLGLTTIGQLMGLPRASLKRRFPSAEQAEAVLLRLDQILGLRDEPLAPVNLPVVFSSRLRFAEALSSKQMLLRALTHLIDEITRQLEAQKQGARQLTFTLWRTDGSSASIKIGMHQPCRNKAHISRLFAEKINHLEPGFGIDSLGLFVTRNDPLSAQQASLDSQQKAYDTTSSAILIDRLRNRLGAQKIGYLHARQSHIPERAQQLAITPAAKRSKEQPAPDRPFLLLNPPEPIKVMAPLPDAPPLHFIWRRLKRKVIASTGPERITREWWHELDQKPGRPRDYYKVNTDEGQTFWLYRSGLYQGDETSICPPQWYMHGFF